MSQWLNKNAPDYFGEGWAPFFTYLFIYLIFWGMNWPVHALFILFWILHLLHLKGLVAFLRRRKSLLSPENLLCWGLLFLALLIPGAYLEYPSDPWSHYELTTLWGTVDHIREHDAPLKFAYFLNWTLIGWLPLHFRRMGLDCLSAIWQWLVLFQAYAFLRRLGFKREWAWVQLISFVVLFGTNLFSYRYYALASTPLAYIAYFRALIISIDLFEGTGNRSVRHLLAPLLLMLFNHVQELLLFCISFGGISTFYLVRSGNGARRLTLAKTVVSLLVIVTGWALIFPRSYAHAASVIFGHLPFLETKVRPWSEAASDLTRFHTINPFEGPLLETYGIHGYVCLLSSLFLIRGYPLFVFLTWIPTLILLWPPMAVAWVSIKDAYIIYRILFAMPLCFALAAALCQGVEKLRLRIWGYAGATLAILLISIPKDYPWRGRGWFQFYRPPAALELRFLEPMVAWLERQPANPNECPLMTDHASAGALWGHAGYLFYHTPGSRDRRYLHLRVTGDKRRDPISLFHELKDPSSFLQMLDHWQVCQVLVIEPTRCRDLASKIPTSEVGEKSGHWSANYVKTAINLPREAYSNVSKLKNLGWESISVPPCFELWNSPKLVKSREGAGNTQWARTY